MNLGHRTCGAGYLISPVQRTHRLRVAVATAMAAVASPAVSADLLTPIDDGRYVLVDHCPAFEPCETDSRRPTTSFAPFDDEASGGGMSASQQSSLDIGSDEVSMIGSLVSESPSEPPLGNTTGDAVFDVTFAAEAAATFSWSGAGTISGGGYGGAFLYDLTADAILFEASLPADRDETGTLEPGHRYRIFHHATTLGQGFADWGFSFSAVPEPGLLPGFAAGAALASWLRRRAAPQRG